MLTDDSVEIENVVKNIQSQPVTALGLSKSVPSLH